MVAQLDRLYIKTRPWKAVTRLLSYALFEGRPLTTRGQWINPLLFRLFELETRVSPPTRNRRPIFIVGTGRSGTTVLGVVLSMHRHVGFLNEPKALWHAVYPHEDLIGSYSRGFAKYRLTAQDASVDVCERARRLFSVYLAGTGSARLVDKYPELIFRIPFVKAIFPDALFVFLVRNGLDTCQSIEQWSGKHGGAEGGAIHDWWGLNDRKWRLMVEQVVSTEPAFESATPEIRMLNDHKDRAALEWTVAMREGMRWMEEIPGSIHVVRYESLTANPRSTLQELLDFCQLPANDDGFWEYALCTLRPSRPRKPVALHPAVLPLFDETMRELGYTL